MFDGDDNATVYYLAGTTGWGPTFGGRPTALWNGPLITANGLVGDVYLNSGDPVTIAVQMMNIEPYLEVEVDWWVVALAGSSWYYMNSSVQWTQFDGNLSNCHPVHQGGLFNLPDTEVLNITDLGPGLYTFYFAVDYPMDGILNMEQIWVDAVTVNVQ